MSTRIAVIFMMLFFSGHRPTWAAGEASVYTAGGVAFEIPPAWSEVPVSSPMRKAQFKIARAEGDQEDGELGVFYFGPGQGGEIDANVDRWAGQFQIEGKKPEPLVSEKQVQGLTVTVVSIQGTFLSGIPMGPQTPKPDYALLGAIVQGPEGPVFFKLTGPKKTLGEVRGAFDALVESFRA